MANDRDPSPDADAAALLAVALCTYRRLPLLARALEHLAIAIGRTARPVELIVVDNDGGDPAVGAAVERFARDSGIRTHYRVEQTPGIAAARNTAFAIAAELDVGLLAMLDDDEWPGPEWLVELLRTRAASGAAVIGGPVLPQFPESARALRRYARYWSVEPQRLAGRPFVFCTCNFLVDLRAIAHEPRPLFDPAFGLSGGEDVVFFRRLFFAGHAMAWSERAVMLEEVTPERASFEWLRRRRVGVGHNSVRWESLDGRAKAFAKTLALTARLAIYPLLGREPGSRLVGWLLEADKVRGRYGAHFGRSLRQYGAAPTGAASTAPTRSCRS